MFGVSRGPSVARALSHGVARGVAGPLRPGLVPSTIGGP